eukprot:gene11593-2110_t
MFKVGLVPVQQQQQAHFAGSPDFWVCWVLNNCWENALGPFMSELAKEHGLGTDQIPPPFLLPWGKQFPLSLEQLPNATSQKLQDAHLLLGDSYSVGTFQSPEILLEWIAGTIKNKEIQDGTENFIHVLTLLPLLNRNRTVPCTCTPAVQEEQMFQQGIRQSGKVKGHVDLMSNLDEYVNFDGTRALPLSEALAVQFCHETIRPCGHNGQSNNCRMSKPAKIPFRGWKSAYPGPDNQPTNGTYTLRGVTGPLLVTIIKKSLMVEYLSSVSVHHLFIV